MRWDEMSTAAKAEYAGRRARQDRVAQGLPETVEDPVVLDRIGRIAAPVLKPDLGDAA